MKLDTQNTQTNEIETHTDVESFEVGTNAIYVHYQDGTQASIENATIAGAN